MSTFYEIDFASLVNTLLPVRLRKPITLSWLKSLIQPTLELHGTFSANRNNNLYTLNHNGQVVYLQEALNDTFDSTSRGIYVTDGSVADPLFVYLDPENEPLYLGLDSEAGSTPYPDPQWLFTNAETALSSYYFLVMVPVAVTFDMSRMKALVDKYRLPSKASYHVMTY